MNLATELLQRLDDPKVDDGGRACLRCRLAKLLEDAGDYDAAREAMRPIWPRLGERPDVRGLERRAAAEVLLRAGTLTGWIGSTRQLDGAQEEAKNLISEAGAIFEELRDEEMAAEAQAELAYCYWRQGELDEARVILHTALTRLGENECEAKALAVVRAAIVERSAKRFNEALRLHTEAAPMFGRLGSDSLKGRFHVGLAETYRNLAKLEDRQEYTDRAFIEYAAAGYHFEQAGHVRYQACVENNIGFLYLIVGKHGNAHEHLDRAAVLFDKLKDAVHAAQVDETRARVLIAEGQFAEAERTAARAVRALERGGELWLLAEALTTRGVALARLARHDEARASFSRASEAAESAGDAEHAGRAVLTMLEESGGHMLKEELGAAYERACELLSGSPNVETLRRLAGCARRVLFHAGAHAAPVDWENFSLREAVLRFESGIIERALHDAGGAVSRAAQMLGMKHHNNLISILNTRHRELLPERKPIVPRRRSIITGKKPRRPRAPKPEAAETEAETVTSDK